MNLFRTFAMFLILSASATAWAQPGRSVPSAPPQPYRPAPQYQAPPYQPPPVAQPGDGWRGFHPRWGLIGGFSFGVGSMSSSEGLLNCRGCDYEPLSGSFDFYGGVMVSRRLAVIGDVSIAYQEIDAEFFDYLAQVTFTGGVKFWILPMLWVKGGVGISNARIEYDEIDRIEVENIDTGFTGMAAIGFEVYSSPRLAVDVALRGSMTNYRDIDERVGTGHLQVGVSFF